MNIRKLNSEDALAYRELRLRGLQESSSAFSSSYEEERSFPIETVKARIRFDPVGGTCTFGAFNEEGQLVGVVTLLRSIRIKTQHKADIVGMYVAPEARRQRVGKALMEAVITHAQSVSGLRQINLTVVSGNKAAYRLYRSLGFTEFGRELEALKVGDQYYDEIFMCMKLNNRL